MYAETPGYNVRREARMGANSLLVPRKVGFEHCVGRLSQHGKGSNRPPKPTRGYQFMWASA